MHLRRASAVFVLVVCAHTPEVRAGVDDEALERARTHFDAGQDLFQDGKLSEAAAEFLKAHEAKPIPAFLYNAAVSCQNAGEHVRAMEIYRRYLTEDPRAADADEVRKRIAELERTAAASQPASQPNGVPPPPAPPPIAEAKTKGVVVIESKPPGAAVYLDHKREGALGETPWNGSLDGSHTVILEAKGYRSERKTISPGPDKLLILYFSLSEEHYLGFIEVRANIPGADVFIDDKTSGAVGRTPYLGNLPPGRHRLWVTRKGFTEVERTIEIEPGKALAVHLTLDKAPVGFVHVRGNETTENARVKLDGKPACQSVPCRFDVSEGSHRLAVSRSGSKPLSKKLMVERATETTVDVRLAPTPSRSDAIVPLVASVGFGAGAYLLWNKAKDVDGEDPDKAKLWRYGAYGCAAFGGLSFLTGVWSLVRDKGPPSTAVLQSRDVSVAPALGPEFAGVAAAGRF